MDFFWKKQDKLLDGHITYQSHMSISKYKPSTYACLWPIEFGQIVVTLGRIFSCFHDQDHVHPHIHANSYTGSYAKHAIHTPKISTPSSKEISLLAKGERGHWKKSICSRSIGKNVLQSKSIEKKKSETWTPSKIKARWEYQSKEYLENKQKYSTHMHISIKLHD
jgi:hypothetical protein